MAEHHEWWQSGIVYQIYPRSFADSNGDGVGDLQGIIEHLDYLCWLGIDAIWLSPIYPSPMKDFGYDISDYCDVHPLFGTLEDFDRLLAAAHKCGLKVILDFVPNHTSDQHKWFLESKQSRTHPKRDWYIWRDPAPDGGPPNNWLSNFGGSAWKFDETTGQYYYHAFLIEQPDVNWRSPQLQAAMHDVLRFWLDRGVDGFRIDVIWYIVKDDQFRNNPRNPSYQPGQNPHHEQVATYTSDRPEVHDIIKGMRRVVDGYPNRMMVGEVYLPIERLVTYYGEGGAGVHMPFNFQLITMPWNARTIAAAVNNYEASLPTYGWPNWVLGNHDNPRIGSRIGREQARVAAMLLLTLRGTPTMYNGEEIGMTDVPIASHQVQDPFEKNVPGMGLGRDPERTPFQWDATSNAGFTRGRVEPWLPIAADYAEVNVAKEREDPRSMIALYRKLIDLRRSEPALAVGAYHHLETEGEIIAYSRSAGGRRFLIVLNLSCRPTSFHPPDDLPLTDASRIILSTYLDQGERRVPAPLELRVNEGVIIRF